MNTFDAIQERRSIKQYDPEHRMREEEIERLLQSVLLSPTAFNLQNWRFVVVRDPELRKRFKEMAWDQSQITDASLLVVLCADLKAWEKEPQRYWRNANKEVQDLVLPTIGQFYRGREQLQRDEAMRSCGIAAQTMMLAAKAMGYDSCSIIGFDFDEAGKLIKLPADHVIVMCIAIGKAIEAAGPRSGPLSMEQVVFTDTF
uniref:Nitroreductase n=1 Tax=Candidatus Kentrum sp. FM TaxID=2126340 RepID=A0A450WUA9_9GAMM|nr:MAG: Nitroreductase [Candidatus Kentron sp. FM]VFJ74141.1 MAG: Nitroreductase [Candidatus Kentron sp. FM]VFK20641.1 MAG: Nitroreductase [Candidatus Kentron sp. FM]